MIRFRVEIKMMMMMIKAGFQLEVGGGGAGEDCHMKGAGILVEYFGPTFF